MSFSGSRRRFLLAVALGFCLAGACAAADTSAQAHRKTFKAAPAAAGTVSPSHPGIEVIQVRADVYVLLGAGANIVVQIGPQGVLIVDSGTASAANEVLATIRRLSQAPIRYIFNTSADADHVGGNLVLARAGKAFGQPSALFQPHGIAAVAAHNAVALRMQDDDYDGDAWPTQTFTDRLALYLNGQGIEMLAQDKAHSEADAVVLFRGSEVLVTGGIFDITGFPVIDIEHGGTIQGEVDALNALIDLSIPNAPLAWLEGGTIVIPAHGRPCQQAELVEYRDMVTIVRDRIRDLKSAGKALRQIIESDPTAGYTQRYGSAGNAATTAFIEAIYQSLDAPAKSP